MENEVMKVPQRLQRFLRLTAVRNGVNRAKVAGLIFRDNKLALVHNALPCADVVSWDMGQALECLNHELGADDFEVVRYLGFCDRDGVRKYSFEISPKSPDLLGTTFVDAECLDCVDEIERKAILAALKRRAAR